MSPVFTIAAVLLVALLVALAFARRRRSPNWTAVSIIVGIVAVVVATGLFAVLVVLAVGEGAR